MPGQLAALAWLGPLRHLDLKVVGVDEVFAGDAESRRRHLLDGAAPRIAVRIALVARRILAAFAGVRLAAEAIHRDRNRLVRFLADRAVRHGAGREALEDRFGRLDLIDRHGCAIGLEIEQAAQRAEGPALVVDDLGELPIDRVLPGSRRVLQLLHGFGVEEVQLAVTPPAVFAAAVEISRRRQPRRERARVPLLDLVGDDVDADAADARGRPREIPVDERLVQGRWPRRSARRNSSAASRCPSSTSP